MQSDLEEAQGVKSEILSDFERIRSKVESAARWEEESKKLKRRNDFVCELANAIHQKHNKLSLQAFNQLHNIKYKFQSNQRIAAQVDFTRVDKIVQEYAVPADDQISQSEDEKSALKEEFSHILDPDNQNLIRDHQIVELIQVISQITNILNFDLKALDVKDSQLEGLQQQLQDCQESKEAEIKEYKQGIMAQIQDVKKDYERKFNEYQSQQDQLGQLNQQLIDEQKQLIEENKEQTVQIQAKDELFQQKATEIEKIGQSQKNFKDAIFALES